MEGCEQNNGMYKSKGMTGYWLKPRGESDNLAYSLPKKLGSPQEVDKPGKEIPVNYEDLKIEDGPFMEAEFKKVKTSLKLGKTAGPDVIHKCSNVVTLMTLDWGSSPNEE